MNRTDRNALVLALKLQRARGKDHAEQLDGMLEDRHWTEVAHFAAYSCQCDALHLKPWEEPPVWAEDDYDPATDRHPDHGRREAHRLLQQMLALGISRYHPDPLAAIAAARKQEENHRV